MLAHLRQTADRLNLPFGDRRMTFNSRRAQELGKWAEQSGRGDAFHQAVLETYFADGRNIAQRTVLEEIARAVGLDPDEARRVLTEGRFKNAVDRDWQRSRSKGVTAVPTFVINDRRLVGARSYSDLTRFVFPDK